MARIASGARRRFISVSMSSALQAETARKHISPFDQGVPLPISDRPVPAEKLHLCDDGKLFADTPADSAWSVSTPTSAIASSGKGTAISFSFSATGGMTRHAMAVFQPSAGFQHGAPRRR
jgi:hypothetical protein